MKSLAARTPFLNRLSLRSRVLLTSLAGVVLLAVLTAAFIIEAQRQNALLTRVAQGDLAAFDRYFDIFNRVTEQHLSLHGLLSKAPRLREEQLYELSKERLDAIHLAVGQLEQASRNLAANDKASVSSVRRQHDILMRRTHDYQRAVASAVEIATVDPNFAGARLEVANEKFDVMNKAFADVLKAQGAKTTAEIARRVHDSRMSTTLIALAAGLFSVVLLSGLSLFLSRLISGSIETEVKAATEAEKMKALGTLVSGVAHEINTPVGVAVTAASSLHDDASRLRAFYTRGTMRKTDLEDFVSNAEQASSVLLRNLERASDLIQSFKQVAVDQSSEAMRKIDVKAYLQEILTSLEPHLKRTRVRYRIQCIEKLEIDCYPGALAQIVTNLVMNAVLHAYDPEQPGELVVAAETMRNTIRLTFRDDGKGIPADVIGKIFDPFFTTRRGAGGSGLGLHIVYNLVTQVLKGTIACDSKVGAGTTFVIEWPHQAAQ
ncbi:MAG TPA: HAMP domain-containing sensor histidine kinase [Paucimonas sp.]|nr:HAMP domain-containing sensor histidine kinase [Paucimonas sp.]